MHGWQEIKIAEHELGDLLDELSPVVCGAPKRAGWVAEWVLDGVLAGLDHWLEPVPYDQFVYRNPGIYSVPVVLVSESNFEYVPQRRKYVRR